MFISLFARRKWRDQGAQVLVLRELAPYLMRGVGFGASPDRPRLPLVLFT